MSFVETVVGPAGCCPWEQLSGHVEVVMVVLAGVLAAVAEAEVGT